MKTTSQLAILVLATFNVSAATLYVSLESPNPSPPFATWATAATNIQHAVDAANTGDTVLVTNGVYAVGWREPLDSLGYGLGPSRVAVTNAIKVESLNGPLVTTIQGGQLTNDLGEVYGVRCVFLGNNAVLSGFTLTNGSTASEWQSERSKGGGVRSEPVAVVTNCVVTSNWAYFGGGGAAGGMLCNCSLIGNSAYHFGGGAYESTLCNCMVTGNSAHPGANIYGSLGGGAYRSTLYNCRVTGNSARSSGGVVDCTLYNCTVTGNSATEFSGGGAGYSTLFNCTVTGNSASTQGGGVANGRLYNCIVYYNNAANEPNFYNDIDWCISYSCTTPLPTNGVGNILGPPLFVDMVADDLRLREGSPCIDVGMNLVGFSATVTNWGWAKVIAYNHDPTDILGNTRFIDGNFDGLVAWDMGAYEFNSFRPPQFTCAPQRMPDCWRLSITGAPNKWVHVQKSSDLKNWEDCWSGWMGTSGVKHVDDRQSYEQGPKAMFYRVVVGQ